MEQNWSWLIELMKNLHIPLILGLHINIKVKNKKADCGNLGDNFPHIFVNNQFSRRGLKHND